MSQPEIPGMQQLIVWLSRPAGQAAPIEVTSMLRGFAPVGILRLSEKASARARVDPGVAYSRIEQVWRSVNRIETPPPPPPSAPPPSAPPPALPAKDATALLSYIFDRYWNLLGIQYSGYPPLSEGDLPDDDQRAVQIMRLMGWIPPEIRETSTQS